MTKPAKQIARNVVGSVKSEKQLVGQPKKKTRKEFRERERSRLNHVVLEILVVPTP
jgi:hypothetical protein